MDPRIFLAGNKSGNGHKCFTDSGCNVIPVNSRFELRTKGSFAQYTHSLLQTDGIRSLITSLVTIVQIVEVLLNTNAMVMLQNANTDTLSTLHIKKNFMNVETRRYESKW